MARQVARRVPGARGAAGHPPDWPLTKYALGSQENKPHLVVDGGTVQTYDICDWRRQMGEDGGRFTGALR